MPVIDYLALENVYFAATTSDTVVKSTKNSNPSNSVTVTRLSLKSTLKFKLKRNLQEIEMHKTENEEH